MRSISRLLEGGLHPDAFDREAILLMAALGFFGDGHFHQSGLERRDEVGVPEMIFMFEGKAVLEFRPFPGARKHKQKAQGPFQGPLRISW